MSEPKTKYYREHRRERLEYQRRYREAHRAEIAFNNKKWHMTHSEETCKRAKEWRKNNPEKFKAIQKRYNEKKKVERLRERINNQ